MKLKQVDFELLKDFGFSLNELIELNTSKDDKFINYKCLTNESVMPTIQAIPLDHIKQAREEIENIGMGSYLEVTKEIECNNREVRMSKKFATIILDKLIAESKEK